MKNKYCSLPFEQMRIGESGNIKMCCPTWVHNDSSFIGRVGDKKIEEIWNSEAAQRFRRSILDNSFKYCDVSRCPIFHDLPNKNDLRYQDDPFHRDIIENNKVVISKPKQISLNYDPSCTFSCPMCRKKRFIAKGDVYLKLKRIHTKVINELENPEILVITGAGDAFGSRIYREFLAKFDRSRFKDTKLYLRTNADLFTKRQWAYINKCHKNIERVLISIDGIEKNSYETIRKGGKIERLQKNIAFISQLKREGLIPEVSVSFAVQRLNYIEINKMISHAKRWNVDSLIFTQLWPGGTITGNKYSENAVHEKENPEFSEFCKIMAETPLDPFIVYTPGLLKGLPTSIKERFMDR